MHKVRQPYNYTQAIRNKIRQTYGVPVREERGSLEIALVFNLFDKPLLFSFTLANYLRAKEELHFKVF